MRRTRLALFWMHLVDEPLVALYSLFPFLLSKDFNANAYQITMFITLRPLLSVLSFYWGSHVSYKKNKLLPNLIGAWVLGRLPFLLFPFIHNFWYFLIACGLYQLFNKAGTPALIEILKRNIPKKPREHLYSLCFIWSFFESVLLGVVFGFVLDHQLAEWKLLFFLGALLSLTSVFAQMRIQLQPQEEEPVAAPTNRLLHPLKETLSLLRQRPDFAHFQWSFMLGGFVLMFIAPALAIYYAKVLDLSHGEIAFARFACMGLGVTLATMFWKKRMELYPANRSILWVLIGFATFPLLLLCAPWSHAFLFLAFFLYGIAQAGSHLLWNLGGTLFAGDGDSSPYTSTSILFIGLRGAVGPILGGILTDLWGPVPVIAGGFALLCIGIAWLFSRRSKAFALQ